MVVAVHLIQCRSIYEKRKQELLKDLYNLLIETRYLDTENQIKEKLSMTATFYSNEETKGQIPAGGVHGVTLKEAIRGDGLLQVATDPKLIPMYTRLKVKLWDGITVPAIALDIGNTVQNKIIDIFVDTNEEAINLGRKSVLVEVLK